MKKLKTNFPDLDFENEENTLKSIEIIQKEFLKKAIKALIYIFIVLGVYITYALIMIRPELFEHTFIGLINHFYYSNLTISWILFSSTIFLFVYFLKIIYLKYTPSLVNFIKNESKNLGFDFQKKSESGLVFLLLNSISVSILIYIDSNIIQIENSYINGFFIFAFSVYLCLSLIIPIFWILFSDKFIIQLKDDFYILFDFHFKIGKPKQNDSNLVGIHLKSNKLSRKKDRCGRIVHSKIAKRRWLSRRKKSKFNPYLHFYEFSTPLNFQKQFLNMALALTEWQIYYGSRILCFDTRTPLNRVKSSEDFLDYYKFFASFN